MVEACVVVIPESPPLQKTGAKVCEQPDMETPNGIDERSSIDNVTNRRIKPPRPTETRVERSPRKH